MISLSWGEPCSGLIRVEKERFTAKLERIIAAWRQMTVAAGN
jgi:hypothetical protein